MNIGILSDSHDHQDNLRKALDILKDKDVKILLHAGDWVSPFMIPIIAQVGIPVEGVFGNNDGDKIMLMEQWKKHLLGRGGKLTRAPRHLIIDNRTILLMHEPDEVDALALSGVYDVIIHGHTHVAYSKIKGKTIIINPGEVYGVLKSSRSVAVYNTEDHKTEIVSF